MSTVRLTIFAKASGRFEVRWDNPPEQLVLQMRKGDVLNASRPIVIRAGSEAELEKMLGEVIRIKHQQGHTVWVANNATGHYTVYGPDPAKALDRLFLGQVGTA